MVCFATRTLPAIGVGAHFFLGEIKGGGGDTGDIEVPLGVWVIRVVNGVVW